MRTLITSGLVWVSFLGLCGCSDDGDLGVYHPQEVPPADGLDPLDDDSSGGGDDSSGGRNDSSGDRNDELDEEDQADSDDDLHDQDDADEIDEDDEPSEPPEQALVDVEDETDAGGAVDAEEPGGDLETPEDQTDEQIADDDLHTP